MDFDTEKQIKKLKRKLWFYRIVFGTLILAILASVAAGYFFIWPYIQKVSELYASFQKVQPYLDQLGDTTQLNQLIESAQGLQTNLDDLKNLSQALKSMQNTANSITNNLQGFMNIFGK